MARLVVIEDNPGDVRLIREAVARADPSVDVVAFEDGPGAVDALFRSDAYIRADLILLDPGLRSTDGLDILRVIRFVPRFAEVPVIVFTSSKAATDEHWSGLLGDLKFVPKPVQLEDYVRVIDDVIRELRRERSF